METTTKTVYPPKLTWESGRLLTPSAWAGTETETEDSRSGFKTLSAVGDLSSTRESPTWSIHLCPRVTFSPFQTQLLCNTIRIACTENTQNSQMECLVPRAGVIWGYSDFAAAPLLFSLEHEVEENEGISIVDTGEEIALLSLRQTEVGFIFCLASGQQTQAELEQVINEYTERDVYAAIAKEWALRSEFWKKQNLEGQPAELICEAIELLASRLEAPNARFPYRWSCGDSTHNVAYNINDIFPLVSAWTEIDPDMAEELFRSALATQHESGIIPAQADVNGNDDATTSCIPLLAQTAAKLWNMRIPHEFEEDILSGLQRYLLHAINYFDQKQTGFCCWTSAEEALLAESYIPEGATVDLTTLMVAEIDAFLELAANSTQELPGTTTLKTHRERLAYALTAGLWFNDTERFADIDAEHHPRECELSTSLLPLLSKAITPPQIARVMQQLTDQQRFDTGHGISSWISGEDEKQVPPIDALQQVLIAEALTRRNARVEIHNLATHLMTSLLDAREAGILFPQDLASIDRVSPSSVSQTTQLSSATSAALAVLLPGCMTIQHTSTQPHFPVGKRLKTFERHNLLILSGCAAFLVLVVAFISIASLNKKQLTRSSIDAMSGLARRYYDEGNYEKAIEIYQQLCVGTGFFAPLKVSLANSLYKNGDFEEAEQHYREAAHRMEGDARPLYNLALALKEQGKYAEAIDVLQQFIEQYQKTLPQACDQAELAISLIEKHFMTNNKEPESD